MRELINYLSKPLHFGILIGILTASFVLGIGRWAIQPTLLAEAHEISLSIEDFSKHVVKSCYRQAPSTQRAAIDAATKKLINHPRIMSATFVSPENKILAMSTVTNEKEPKHPEVRTVPILNAAGETLGILSLVLNEPYSGTLRQFRKTLALLTLLGFLLGMLVSYSLLQRANISFEPMMDAIKKVSEGNLDIKFEGPLNGHLEELAIAFEQMVEGLKERDRMRHSLGRIMDPKIADILIKQDPKVGGRRRKATIMFCDIRNYTSICEQLTPDELQVFLNEYWKGTVEIIMEQEGTIDKFHGDGVCVVFGAPTLHDDDPLRAVRVAWRLLKNVETLNKKRVAARQLPIQIGIGIHTGEVIAGHIGSERRMDYTVVGDVVNVAARIEELNKKFGTTILISDELYEHVEDHVLVKTLTLAHLRGHKRPILVHTIRDFFDDSLEEREDKAA